MTDDITSLSIKKRLNTRIIGRQVLYFPTLPSTMDTARDQARKGADEGCVVIAGEQTAGRGRLQRSWLSPQGNIALSIILRPDIASLPYLIMIASLASARSIEAVTGQKTQVKWPNDVLIGGKKVCGILIENEFKGNKCEFAIIGIGINTDLKVAVYKEIADIAVSLSSVPGINLRPRLIQALLTEFETLYLKLPNGQPIYEEWRSRLVTLGKNVKATWGEEVIKGLAETVDESGALFIRDEGEELRKVVAGDVTLRE